MSASKTPEEIEAANNFASFADPCRAGYETGYRDSMRAEDAAAERYRHEQTVLRSGS